MAGATFSARYATRESVWRTLGTEFTDHPTVEEAFQRAGLLYTVEMRPMFIPHEDGYQEVPNRFAITRLPTPVDNLPRVFSVVSDRYSPLQNLDMARALDVLTDKFPVVAAGARDFGETSFAVLDAGEIMVKGRDAVRNTLIARDRKSGGTSFRLALTPIRMGCTNMLNMMFRKALIFTKLLHQGDITQLLIDRTQALRQVAEATAIAVQLFDGMADARLSTDDVQAALSGLYPAPEEPDTKDAAAVARFERRRDENAETISTIQLLFTGFNEANPWAAMSPWSLYNSVVEFEDYRSGRGEIEESVVWGWRAKAKEDAFALLSQHIAR